MGSAVCAAADSPTLKRLTPETRGGADYVYPTETRAIVPPVYRGNTVGLNGPSPLAFPDRDVQSLSMRPEFVADFVGEKRAELAATPAVAGATALTLVIRTDPARGSRRSRSRRSCHRACRVVDGRNMLQCVHGRRFFVMNGCFG